MNARAAFRIAATLGLFAVIAPLHIVTKTLLGRSNWPRRFLGAVAWVLGARVDVVGPRAERHTLLVPNHTSWFDILLLGGIGSAFVSKDELGHPLIHWLADQNGTIYVKRGHVKGAKDQAHSLARALEGDKPVTVFPEGTTGPGTYLLPFRSTLLEAANYAAKDVEIRPVAIDYGAARAEFGWFSAEPGKDNVLRLLGRRGTVRIRIHLLPPLDRSGDRKRLTREAFDVIAQTLGLTLYPHSPIVGGQ